MWTEKFIFGIHIYVYEYICVCVCVFNEYICAHIHEITNEKGDHGSKGEWGGIYERVWEEEGEGINVTIKL